MDAAGGSAVCRDRSRSRGRGEADGAAVPPASDGPRSAVGLRADELDTPALCVDLDAVEHNARTMAGVVRAAGAVWRPHMKAVRCAEIAKLYLAAGAVGITCAKVAQARAMVDGGVTDVLVGNEVVGARKVRALVELARRATVCVAVDDEGNLRDISRAAAGAGARVGVVVDCEIGMGRCGVPHADQATVVALCRLASTLPGIEWRGLMGYDGHAQTGSAEARAETERVAGRLSALRDAVEAAGLRVPLVTGAGSGNYVQASGLRGVTEVQGGGGALFCRNYEQALAWLTPDHTNPQGTPEFRFEPGGGHKRALFLVAQVVSVASQATAGTACGDAGWKASFPTLGELPAVVSHPGVRVTGLNAEHTIFAVAEDAPRLALGERVWMHPFYSDSTVCLHRTMYGLRRRAPSTAACSADGVGGGNPPPRRSWADGYVVEQVYDLTPSIGQMS